VDVVAAEQGGDFSGQVSVAEQKLQKGVADIAINPIDANAIVIAVKKANKNNIPVLMENTINPADQGDMVEYIGYNQWAGAAASRPTIRRGAHTGAPFAVGLNL
jgi:ribose transport system substrate-binding protein